ncbi:hypothetical protein GOP47_0025906 [Adiantum capillus-veneris]|uniref:Major facilitator superfamily (MFS) profile domain-containing protein n=1 Tax=Adiantum capillus-veneris TaxID=13818 RepID=A0A9D4Z3Z6_ADICA|nr:hypothetical protein GOP47_0025906 [Adiantum capillus-veneris]
MNTTHPDSKLPLGIVIFSKLCKKDIRVHEYRIFVLLLTFTAYACFHASRKPLSIVKSVLDPEVSQNFTVYAEPPGFRPASPPSRQPLPQGALGDRLDLRKFLTFGMVVTGLLSSIGWPVVVAIVANWFGKTKRGLIMGIWNAHASVGNIMGSIVAAAALRYGWGWSFLFPGLLLIMCALLVYCFLIVDPASLALPFQVSDKPLLLEAGKSFPEKFEELNKSKSKNMLLSPSANENGAVQFFEAWSIPGVALYAFCLFFVKLVAYTFLFWLPFYIRHTEIDGKYLSDKMAGYLSTIFDIGGVIGGIAAGYLSDKYNLKAIIAVIFMYCAVPSLYLFRTYGGRSLAHAVGLMIVSGIFVNGPYALITTAVSADLGTHNSLNGNARALATVSAIIDGTGSVGAAIGPFITVSTPGNQGEDSPIPRSNKDRTRTRVDGNHSTKLKTNGRLLDCKKS